MTTLKQAINDGQLAKFVKEHRRDPKGNATAFSHTLEAMAGKSRATPATLKKADPAD
jgi:hypothetical protein